ncbi:MAG TPA: TonB system transport protein ExbD [Geminicoccus sp.]|uniref:TonB system transport protein ExbD n=1 Tax=Geminicoccus sp. TaxID=2024832 RepID=UPI002B6BE229|nr:TonB system transport protein ExbD [Geminicoccus sp.]HWL68499.1 TonB system transport protein ExbD [Geminicoccus sp.]
MAAKLDDGDDLGDNHDINVTPFIDVVLVLLIIFMVAAPLATADIAVDLPPANAKASPRPKAPVFVSLQKDLSVAINSDEVERAAIGTGLDRVTSGDKEQRIFIRADEGVPYGEVMAVMNLMRAAGYLKVGLVGLEAVPAQ